VTVSTPRVALLPTIFRHLCAYAEIAGQDARDAAGRVGRRVFALLLAAVCVQVALFMLCAWILSLAWDGPWRAWAAAGLAFLFAAVAAAIAIPLLGRRRAGTRLFPRVRYEWSRDRELIERAMNGGDHAAG
jgi:hypothetical protein